MKFLLDSCISGFAARELRSCGHDVEWVLEWESDPGDPAILDYAYREDRILVTADTDFGELVHVYGQPHASIIRLAGIPARLHGISVLQLLKQYEIQPNMIITIETFRVRIRRM